MPPYKNESALHKKGHYAEKCLALIRLPSKNMFSYHYYKNKHFKMFGAATEHIFTLPYIEVHDVYI